MHIKRAITLSPIALQHLNFSFPDCSAPPLSTNGICNTSLDYYSRASALVSEFTTTELVNNTINFAPGVPRLGIPNYQWWTEALHGVAGSPGVNFNPDNTAEYGSATSFPQIINLGATFDDALYQEVASHIANETRAYSNAGKAGLNMYSPLNINAFRDPRWGRGQETVGEDPLHLSRYAVKVVHGLQGPAALDENNPRLSLAATCKHYLAYDVEEYQGVERYQFNALVSKQDLADFFLPQFRACVRDGGATTLMTSYNAVNSVPPSASKYYLETLARKSWGLSKRHNYVTSDCDAVANVYDGHHYANNYVQAAADSMNAGCDLDCGATYSDNLGQALEQNLTDVATIRRAVTRMFSSLVRLGYFDSAESQPLRQLGWNDVNAAPAQRLAYTSAVSSITLLKNHQSTLPLKKDSLKGKKIAVIGPYTNATYALRGNYDGPSPFTITVLDAAKRTFTDSTVVWANGTSINGAYNSTSAGEAKSVASDADVIIFAGGIDPTVEGESLDRTSIAWPSNQLQLISDLSSLNKTLVVAQFGGGQVDGAPLKSNSNVGALLWAGYPGQSGALALMDVVAGNVAPSGRLPITQYPADYIDGLSEATMALRANKTAGYPGRTYKWYDGKPTYPFGFGLHYTKWSASMESPSTYTISSSEEGYAEHVEVANVKVNLKSIGKVTSDYAALLFAKHQNGPAPYPKRTLVGYAKVKSISPGEQRSVEIVVTQAALARADEGGNEILYPGEYTLELDTEGCGEGELASTKLMLEGQAKNVIPWVQGDMS
ncbi:Glycoside hydrolase, family 3, N-terminal [Kalmanozyma brasiliensis GHG001]|uniref:xylan 1,4-beta-xylosidase n=1 Tax=Kalmanozyma brasiliensis (strain GHG001) TaxID=1365824 RepID=V5EUU0_KALBG|nr:Glycoside hydrolase, family 3, N-terminal [Kalmanozyma brasiliensis GHG001]EST06953.1 Glycoside hydrolase, family 3, N-terminal [Kalmanozyma brasiliensis GHG001]